jgi:asparagine synthase (glutamine-hydrolysing)
MNLTVKLTRNNIYPWYCRDNIHAKGYFFSPEGKLYKNEDLCSYFNDITNEESFRQKLLSANGIFSVIIQQDQSVWIATDRFRYFPVFYRKKDGLMIVGDDIDNLYEQEEEKEFDEDNCFLFTSFSYVLGNKTLLKDVFQIQAGEYVRYDGQKVFSSFYHQHFSETQNISFEEAKRQLKSIFHNVMQRMGQLIENRPVMLSLSGGLDSRIIAYFLKKAEIKNVLCYTFGIKERNPEWERSKTVAEKLGFEWLFVDYSSIREHRFYQQKQFIDFYTYESQYVSKFAFIQYFAANHFINNLKIPQDSILFVGHGGDFFSGSHLRPYMQSYQSLSVIAQDLQYLHCNLVKLNKKERRKIYPTIKQGLVNTQPLFCNVENWDLKERQAKYIINTNKLWEYFGIETQMPLCDTELMDFFVSLPFGYRLNQKLYRTVLHELFEEFGINFPQDSIKQEKQAIQQLKIMIKRMFPSLRKNNDLFQHDYFDSKRFLQPVLEELQSRQYPNRKIISYNGIFTCWYLLQVKQKLQSLIL